jgi:peptidoglycan/xylan/chitin deacetylase (PgdA/CDA1 family)
VNSADPRWRQFLYGGLATTLLSRSGLGSRLPRRWYLVRGPKESRALGLTFDDGPHPEHTPRLLDVLKREGIVATFFVIGREAERYPDLIRRMVAEGHVVGNHTYMHSDPVRMRAREFLDEVQRTHNLLTSLIGSSPPPLLRPPYGRLTVAKLIRSWRAGQSIVLWNVDAEDFASRSADEVQERLERHAWQSGDLILMHDNHPHASLVVPELAQRARASGLTFTTIASWVA